MTARAPVYNEIRPVRLWARFEPDLVEKLNLYAAHQGITRSGLMRLVIEQWLEARPEVPEGPPATGKRSYDRSRYMKERVEARKRAAVATAAAHAIENAQGGLQDRWLEITRAIEDAKQALEAAAAAVVVDPEKEN